MRWLGFLSILGVLGCESAPSFCDDVPTLTWENFGKDFMQHNCQTCHSSTTANRNGAPEDVVFDSHEAVRERRIQIVSQIIGPEPLMPPSGGLDADVLWRAEVWLECFE
jgi:hypothetical protein